MTGFNHIVVALGASGGDTAIIEYASLIASFAGAQEVRFVHVLTEPPAEAGSVLERMRADVAHSFTAANTTTLCDVLRGSLTDRLLAYVTEHQSDLIMIGAKKHKLGARLAMVAPCSVAVVPERYPAKLSHLMIAVDFSDAAAATLQWATSMVTGDRTIRCTVVHVVTPESADFLSGEESLKAETEAMRQFLERANRHDVPVETRMVSVERTTDVGRSHFAPSASIQGADVAHTILAEAEKCGADCIALSTRGRSRSAAILLGSVTEKVIERSPVPLLVGKHSGKNLGLASILLGHAGWTPANKSN